MDDQKSNIQRKELILNKTCNLIEKLESVVAEWDDLYDAYQELMDYYSGEQWINDVEASDTGAFSDMPHGVLSQDAVYNMYSDQRLVAFRLIRTALRYIEK